MAAPSHPIAALDASYYGNPIVDYGGRLQAAVKSAQSQWHLPDCNYLVDIRAKQPAIVDRLLRRCGTIRSTGPRAAAG